MRTTYSNEIIDIAMEDAPWFNLVPDLDHEQTHARIHLHIPSFIYSSDPHRANGNIEMNDVYAFIETKDVVVWESRLYWANHPLNQIPDLEKDMVMEDESMSESREGLRHAKPPRS